MQPVDSDAMARSLKAGRRVTLAQVGLFADGVAVKQVGQGNLPPVPATGRRNHPGRHRRHLRRDQGRVRGHPLDPRAGRCAGRRRRQAVCRAERHEGQDAGRHHLRREHEFRPPALRRRARRSRRAARSHLRRDHPRAPGSFHEFLRSAGRAQRHRIQLPHRGFQRSACLRRRAGARPRRDRAPGRASCASHGLPPWT